MSCKKWFVVGPPGTGKTAYLSRQVARAAAVYGERILVCSLTRAAAREAARRVALPERNIGTLHSFAYRLLGYPTLAEGKKPVAEWNALYPHYALRAGLQGSVDSPRSELAEGDMAPGDFLKLEVGRFRALEWPMERWPSLRAQGFAYQWNAWKRERGYLDFTDLIDEAIQRRDERAPDNPAVLIVDEAQDLDRMMLRLLYQWAEHCEWLIMAGDQHQALYVWRGSDPHFLEAGMREGQYTVLEQSYRVPAAVHAYAMQLMERFRGLKPVAYKARACAGDVRHVTFHYKQGEEVVRYIAQLLEETTQIPGAERRTEHRSSSPGENADQSVQALDEYCGKERHTGKITEHPQKPERCPAGSHREPKEGIQWSEEDLTLERHTGNIVEHLPKVERCPAVMVMATCGYMLEATVAALRRAGVPFHNPWRRQHGGWNPLGKRPGTVTFAERVLAFSRMDIRVWGSAARFWSAVDVKCWAGILPARTCFKRGKKATLERLPEHAPTALVTDTLAECLTAEALGYALDSCLEWYLATAEGTEGVQKYVQAIMQRGGIALLRETPQVVVGTVHSLKGSEAQTVILFPDLSMAAWRQHSGWDDEVLRTFYVGVTRARHTLVLANAAGPGAFQW